MRLKFKIQPYQTQAVAAVVDCFHGQPRQAGCGNGAIELTDAQLLSNIQAVQRRQNLAISPRLESRTGCPFNLDVEMETGTGKTYVYIKTIFELNAHYGWNSFIAVVPSIAIREGLLKSLQTTADHFAENYGQRIRFFAYDSRQLHQLEGFSMDAGINLMVINIQAFNATGKDHLRIYEDRDDFQSRKPIDVISGNRPILILDEPQRMEGRKTLEALARFRPLMILRYSATHAQEHNRVYRLDAVEAYRQKLVKKIAVRGITTQGLTGSSAYLYLESIEVSRQAPRARLELEVRHGPGVRRVMSALERGTDLFAVSRELESYRGFVIAGIDAQRGLVEFTNGRVLAVGATSGDVTEMAIRRIQIREAIHAHLEKERKLFAQGIKVLSLFFIDEVAKYRDYGRSDERGEYARIFEEEYGRLRRASLQSLPADDPYAVYLGAIAAERTHSGYFSMDRKTKRWINPEVRARGEDAGMSDDVDAYDLILKDKERLLSLAEPVRFLFSHSALREGWDNPNVFVLGMLKPSSQAISRRQEVGRGLRLCVNQEGDRQDNPITVHEVNVLTIVANEGYQDFVTHLQREIREVVTRPGGPLPEVLDDRQVGLNTLNARFESEAFQVGWNRIRQRVLCQVDFDATALIQRCIQEMDEHLRVPPLRYVVEDGVHAAVEEHEGSIRSEAAYDLLGRIAGGTQLTRRTIAAIFRGLQPSVFAQFNHNPEAFLRDSMRLITGQKAASVVSGVSYQETGEVFGRHIFEAAQSRQDFSRMSGKLDKHVYDFAVVDSRLDLELLQAFEASERVAIYARLPPAYRIPTPVGDYHPRWLIVFQDRTGLVLGPSDQTGKAECARRFFAGKGVRFETLSETLDLTRIDLEVIG